jgi:hypothetical protein
VGPPESTSTGWILLFYGSGSKTGSTSGVFDRNLTLFKFKRSKEIVESKVFFNSNLSEKGDTYKVAAVFPKSNDFPVSVT